MAALALALLAPSLSAQEGYQPTPENQKAREEFASSRFGIFIHWGIYSMLGNGEWVMRNEDIPYQEYSRLAAGFYPSKFNAKEWISAIKDSGAKYITVTSRHHDGFSMFDTDQSDYNVVDATPYGKDVIKALAKECHKQGISLHLYYSHLDWGRSDYWPRGIRSDHYGRPIPAGEENLKMDESGPSWEHYKAFMSAQLTELLTKYGEVGAIWFDGVWEKTVDGNEADQPRIWGLYDQYELIHKLQPACLVGNNHHLVPFPGEDMQIFERDVPGDNTAGYSGESGISDKLPLETCQTMNRSWGYHIKDKDYKSVDQLIRLLARTSGKGANLLLNIGPRPDGTLPEEALERLHEIGKWLKVNGEAIYGTTAGPVEEQEWGVTTRNGKAVYVHVLNDATSVTLAGLGDSVESASLLATGAPVKTALSADALTITLPDDFKSADRVVKLILK